METEEKYELIYKEQFVKDIKELKQGGQRGTLKKIEKLICFVWLGLFNINIKG